MTDVSIVIVNYNTRDYTAQCIDSILATKPAASYEILLVDNASSDGSVDWLAQRFPDVKLIASHVNAGIAGGNNLGIKTSEGDFVLLLNNDTIVLPGSIDRLVGVLKENSRACGVGGPLLNPDGSFQSGFDDFPSLWQLFLIFTKIGERFNPHYPTRQSDSVREVDWISTAFMLFRRKALESVGLVDEEYFIYSDESDLQYRLSKAGWSVLYVPDAPVVHFGGKSLTPWRRRKMVYRGYLLFFQKHYGSVQASILRLMFASISLLKLPFWVLAYLFSTRRDQSKSEVRSNLEILRMCLQRGAI